MKPHREKYVHFIKHNTKQEAGGGKKTGEGEGTRIMCLLFVERREQKQDWNYWLKLNQSTSSFY